MNVAQSEEAFLIFPSGLYRVKRTNLHLSGVLNGAEHSSMKSAHSVSAVFLGPLFHIRVQKASPNGLFSSQPYLSTAKTASFCIPSRAPYGPICTAQIAGVASDQEKRRPSS